MPDEAEEHHNVVVEGKSLVTNDQLLEVYQGSDPPVFSLLIKGVEECAELDCRVSRWIVSRLNVDRVDDGVGHDGSQVHHIDSCKSEKNEARIYVARRPDVPVEVHQLEGKGEP